MKTFQNISLALFAAGAFFLGSCDTTMEAPVVTPVDPFENLIYIGETEVVGAGAIAKLYAEDDLFVGYNRLHVALFDSASPTTQLTDAHVTFAPLMDMGMMQHACPFEDPGMTVEDGTNTFKGAVVFIMPTTATGNWMLNIDVHNHANNQEGTAALTITVVEPEEPRLLRFISDADSTTSLFVALIDPMDPEIGLNDFNLGIYKRETMMSFPGVEGIEVDMEPEMPSMNHGSPSNIHPISVGNGRYEGVVNFTMTGYWKVNLNFEDANGTIIKADQYFDITF